MATEKQKKAFEKSLENNGNVSKAMREVGYSKNYSKNPQDLKKSTGWQELLEKYIPDDLLQQKIKEGLEATKEDKPDFAVRHKYVDTSLKLRDKYPAEKRDVNLTLPNPILNGISSDDSNIQNSESEE
jgi:hypothetical protein